MSWSVGFSWGAGAAHWGSCRRPSSHLSILLTALSTLLLGASKGHTLMSGAQTAHSPPVLQSEPQRSSNQPRKLISPMWDPRTGVTSLWLSLLTPRAGFNRGFILFLWAPSQGHRSQPVHFSCLPIWFPMALSYSPGYKEVFLPVSSANCSTYRCFFVVFVNGGEFHDLLLCYFDLTDPP